ncbi:type IX secretion system outer membrane channel protein PorV [Gaoshiqia sp. Z1-71]|uniref:type IX secretion system outer membrane channel protein PorV n=1 Tax=Gaoshiqia hydrogeniformans TaxID=3290090 RepID=UPI003BF9267B
MKLRFAVITAILLMSIIQHANAQSSATGANTISTAVPFLTIAPDSRAGGMGDAGVATSPDMNSQHWNPAKYAFMESDLGVGLSYTPWLRNLIDDINLAYLAGYKKLDDVQTISASLLYFALGEITFMDSWGNYQGLQNPNEFAFDVAYSRLLSEKFSGSVALRYIRSDLTGGQMVGDVETHAGNSFAADIAFYFRNEMRRNRRNSVLSAGLNISNIGNKISYSDGMTKDFIPTNLRLGTAYETELNQYNTILFTVDFNKLLVPTPNIEVEEGEGGVIVGGGFSQDKSVISGMFTSFTDAPGGFKEELQEVNISTGFEYWYNKQFAIRGGYFYEHENKGNRKFVTFGAGLKLNVFALDFSYLVPTQRNHPLANTLRFSLLFDFEAFNSQRR